MFEKEIKFIADVNLNKIKNFGSFILFEKFENSDVHPAIKQYISAELDYLIHEDRKKLLEKSVFDYSGAEVTKHFNAIAKEVRKNKKISFEDIKKLILQAVSFNLNYLIRPKWSLSKLVYNDAETKTVEEIKLNLNYVYFFEHIKSILIAYLNKRNLVSLSVTEFEIILDKIDKEIFNSDEKKIIDYTLYTMADFINTGSTDKTVLPPVAVELFLKEKNQIDKVIRLKKNYNDGSKQSVEVEEIKKVIYSKEPMEYEITQPEEKAAEVDMEEDLNPEQLDIREINLEEVITEKTEDGINTAVDNEEKSAEKEKEIIEDDTGDKEIETEPEYDSPELKVEEINEGPKIENDLPPEIEEKSPDEIEDKSENNLITEEIDVDSETELDDSFLAYYESELKTLEEDISELKINENDDDDLKSIQEDLTELKDSKIKVNETEDQENLFEFEEETDDLIQKFSEEPEIETVQHEDEPELSVDDDFEIEESEELTREFLNDEDISAEEKEEIEEFDDEMILETSASVKRNEDDLFDYLSNKDIEKIVANVFNDDREDFANTMEKLAECESYEEATEILKSVFLTYRVNPYSKEAVTLTNSVANFFEQG